MTTDVRNICPRDGCEFFTMPPHTTKQLEDGEHHQHKGCVSYHFGRECPKVPTLFGMFKA